MGFRSVTNATVGLWSSEVLHTVGLRTATFRALCPDSIGSFAAWWGGSTPPAGTTSSFVLFDPIERPRSRRFVDLGAALRVEPRWRGCGA
jgi:hypothetical protein